MDVLNKKVLNEKVLNEKVLKTDIYIKIFHKLKMSAKDGLCLPNGIFPTVKELKTLFDLKIRVSVILKVANDVENGDMPIENERLEYQFLSNKNIIHCVMCKSILGDFLGFCGLKYTFDEFIAFFEQKQITKNKVIFEKVKIVFFPATWYACFESDKFDSKWDEIKSTLSSLKLLSESNLEDVKLSKLSDFVKP